MIVTANPCPSSVPRLRMVLATCLYVSQLAGPIPVQASVAGLPASRLSPASDSGISVMEYSPVHVDTKVMRRYGYFGGQRKGFLGNPSIRRLHAPATTTYGIGNMFL